MHHKLRWALVLRVVTGFDLNLAWFRPFYFILSVLPNPPWYDSTLGSSNSPRSLMAKCGRGRPAGLGFTPFWPNFSHADPGFKQSSKLVELVNVSKNYSNMVPKA